MRLASYLPPFLHTEVYIENAQKQARAKEYEHQINQMVYKLYVLM